MQLTESQLDELLSLANFVLNCVGWKMEKNDNGEGEGFKNIVDIETGKKIGQQPIHYIDYQNKEAFQKNIICVLAHYKFSQGFKFFKKDS